MDTAALAQAVAAGDRRALARAITLAESSRADHRARTAAILTHLARELPSAGRQALRLGLSGTPGAGKSTLIEALGLHLVGQGLRVAVLAVDPSSERSGGSVLGDKTRMERLSRDPRAFIRPSPSSARLGGVAARTRDAVALCEGAGFDVVVIETVGVGQSETAVADMTDVFALVIAPAGGDELQGVKRGIMERADLVLVNKADGVLRSQAALTRADYGAALRLMRPRPQDPEGFPRALTVSALTGEGIEAAWQAVTRIADWRKETGVWARTRAEQARAAFRAEVMAALMDRLSRDPDVARRIAALEGEVALGRLDPAAAAARVLGPEGGA